MPMKKLFNVRYPLIVFLVVAFAVLSVVCVVYHKLVWAVFAFFILSAFVTWCFVKGQKAVAVVLIVSYLLGLGVMALEVAQIKGRAVSFDGKCVVSGYVCDANLDGSVLVLVLDDVVVTSNGQPNKLPGKTKTYVYDSSFAPKLGTRVSAVAKVENLYVFRDKVNALDYCNGIYYKLTSASGFVYSDNARPSLDKRCLNYVKQRFAEVCPNNAGVAYALVTGDRSLVEDDALDGFRDAGVMHVFAVSGLHVGFVVAVLGWLLDRLKLRGWGKLCALVVPLTLYAYICGFPASVVRATVMTAVSLLLGIFWRKTDVLNSASISAVLLVVINPLNLFNAGFLLSFGAVYGIATISAAIARYVKRKVTNKLVAKLLLALGVSLGATAGTVLVSAYYFGSVATLSVVANLVVVPLVSVIFVFLAISLLPYFFGYLGAVPDLLLSVVRWISNSIAHLPFATASTLRLGVALLFWVALMFVIGGYVNVKGKAKGIVCIALCICMLGSCVVANIAGLDDGSLYLVDSNEGVLAVASDGEGNYLVVSNCTTVGDVQKIVDRLSRFRVNSLSLAFTCYRKVNVNALQLLMDKYHVDNAYVFDGTGNDVVDAMLIRNQTKAVVVPPNNPIPLLDAKIVADGVPLGLALCCKHISFVIVYDTSDVLLARLAQLVDADVVYSAAYLPMLETRFAKSVVLFGEDTKGGHKNSLTECGNFTICSKSGTIKVTNGGGM